MKSIVVVLVFTSVIQISSFATLQETDILIWNSDTLYLNKSPFESLPDVYQKIREKEEGISSGCWNGFIAEWIIIDNTLYLQNIYSHFTGKKINRRVEKILDRKFENGCLKADWYSGEFIGGYGRYLHCMFYIVYEKERLLKFNNGELEEIKKFDAKDIEFSINEDKVEDFVYKNFDWSILDPNNKSLLGASIYIEANESGSLEKLDFESSGGYEIDNEVERIIRLIPNWGTYYWDGKPYSFLGSYYFEFSQDKMKKYAR
ncbi:hypothetical protein [Carboxylicivirga sp. RSCT41]|uniref:hypothetical protein n=1 Tax=Carboxylicivirga agarovorans TaxID=3417570 RepID=UPI003D336BD8